MRTTILTFVLFAAGCVKGNPHDHAVLTTHGGTLEIEDCGYAVTTREGAEPPHVGVDLVGDDPSPRLVHLGFIGDPKTSMVAQWRTTDETTEAGTVRFAAGANLTEDQLAETGEAITFAYESGVSKFRMHQGHMCGLTAGTAYSYQVGTEGHFSPVYTFHTAPDIVAHPDTEIVVGSLGDCRDGYDIWEMLLNLVKDRTPDLVLFSGDAVLAGITQNEWESFLGRGEPLFATVPLTFAEGNHEFNAVNYYSQFALPGDQEDFSFDFGHAHFTVLNDSPGDISDLMVKAPAFLDADLAAHKSMPWHIVMHHQPLFSSATAHGSNLMLQQYWQPLYDKHHVDLVLNGHDHDFELSKPMVGAASNPAGTVYLVQGGAGAELYTVAGSDVFTDYKESTFGASVIRIRANQLALEAFRPDNSPIPANFTKTK